MNGAVGVGVDKRAGNLPADATSFLGRRHEITEVKRLLSTSRLVTLTGPGGVGKTRLALRTAADLRRAFRNQVWFVELAELRDASLLANTVAEKLGIHDQSSRAAVDTIIDHIAAGPLLLVLDNCEHLVDECAVFVNALIRSCPELRVLATSRQSLSLLGETTFPVAPFRVPDPEHKRSPASIAHFDSVRLFVERATEVVPRFSIDTCNCETLAEVCHNLDGIPLAIELTAVRLRALSLDQIAQRLTERYRLLSGGTRGAPPRQRTLRALIDWSYDLCSQPERRVWARASVFSGNFGLDAIEYVASGDDVERAEILNVVDSLVDKSILMREEDDDGVRYRLLQTTREYGEEKLLQSGEYATVHRRHRDWHAQIAARFDAEWIGPDQVAWINRLRRDHPNLRTALNFCTGNPGEAVAGMRMATQIDDYWGIRGFHTEARHWLDQALAVAPDDTPERVSALRMDAWFALLQGDFDRGLTLLAEATESAERIGHETESAYLTQASGIGALMMGELDKATTLLEEALSRFRAAKVLRGELFTLFMFGLTLGLKGERERGLALLDECIDITSRLGDMFWRSYAYWSVAHIEVLNDALDRAEAAGKDALRLQQPLENRLAMAFTIDTLAWIAERREQHTRAAMLFGTAAAVWDSIGAAPNFYATFEAPHREHIARTRQALGDDSYEAAFQSGYQLPIDLAIDYALETEQPGPRPAADERHETPLTRREQEIAELVVEGLTNKDIAARLFISQRTAEAHVEHILTKLGFTSRTQIASWLTARQVTNEMDV
jgi:predicted ATPase/DNA-binding NarL/FixJ family response regulator